ncbi:hypothetical protein L5515_015683 [Caenorhabditis briggsae]|uniref:BTB domain-containing protein n=1 Tax=Caenorhabditis briggsae TaxID=6238 RepID=A0AAE9EGI9_CAEBR|nr:hypothetical protein L5515_015683 [Caenorhabditis briggsae]
MQNKNPQMERNAQFVFTHKSVEDAIDDDTVERILQIADMYETPLAIKKCEKFLIKKSKMELKKKLELTEKYGLEELKKAYQKPI